MGATEHSVSSDAARGGSASMISGLEGKAAEKAVDVVVERVIPKLADYGKMLFSGRKFLLLGPPRSGKSSFLQFLEYLVLEPEKRTMQTVRIERGDDRVLKLGPDGRLILRIRKPRDVPGQEPNLQVEYVREYAPHCVVVVLDVTTFDSGKNWFDEFCQGLDFELLRNPKVAKKLKSLIIVMNKWDKITEIVTEQEDKEYRKIFESELRGILDARFRNPFYGPGGDNRVEVVPCCLVSGTVLGRRLANQLVQSVALSLTRR
jgi:hypothetical protein